MHNQIYQKSRLIAWTIATCIGCQVSLNSPDLTVADQPAPAAGDAEGIARRFPRDVGIEADPAVIFVEQFEGGDLGEIAKRWDMVRDAETMSLAADAPVDSSGTHSLLISQRAEQGTGGDFYRRLGDGHDRLFVANLHLQRLALQANLGQPLGISITTG